MSFSTQNESDDEQTIIILYPWWCHDIETLSTLLTFCEGNPPVTSGFVFWLKFHFFPKGSIDHMSAWDQLMAWQVQEKHNHSLANMMKMFPSF